MLKPTPFDRRKLLLGASALCMPMYLSAKATGKVVSKPIPSSGEALPVVGLGTSRVFDAAATSTEMAPRLEILQSMHELGATLIDSSPMYGQAEAMVGALLKQMPGGANAFVATKVWTRGKDAGLEQMQTSSELMASPQIDLMQVHNLQDTAVHMESIRALMADKRIRYSGLTHYRVAAYPALMQEMKAHRPDFIQFNYSISIRDAEKTLLPMAADQGIAVLANRSFENGALFRAVKNKPLPQWAADFDIRSWGQFFLKYVISHPAVNAVIPGTSKPHHMLDNLGAGMGE
ncbi:MAG: aldo/keto reductase, partial [Pseudomonadota bacterium]